MQKTISWKDANFAKEPGSIQVSDRTLHLQEEHISRWTEDPEGRFSVTEAAEDGSTVQLERFYPSL